MHEGSGSTGEGSGDAQGGGMHRGVHAVNNPAQVPSAHITVAATCCRKQIDSSADDSSM